jgi:hypothetical protein
MKGSKAEGNMTSPTDSEDIVYRKTKGGEWVVYGPADRMAPGKVTVHRQDGSTGIELIHHLGQPFVTADGRTMVYGYLESGSGRRLENGVLVHIKREPPYP